MFPRARLDGIFSVAMTLLVLDVRLPDDFHSADGGELLQGRSRPSWSNAMHRLRRRSGSMPGTLLIDLISMRIVALTAELETGDHLRRRITSASLLAVSSLLALALSFVNPGIALWGLAFNFAQPVLARRRRQAAGAH